MTQEQELQELMDSKWESLDEDMREAYELGRKHGPAWHDAPTCEGKWLDESDCAFDVVMRKDGPYVVFVDGEDLDSEPVGNGRYFGPIPEDEVKS